MTPQEFLLVVFCLVDDELKAPDLPPWRTREPTHDDRSAGLSRAHPSGSTGVRARSVHGPVLPEAHR